MSQEYGNPILGGIGSGCCGCYGCQRGMVCDRNQPVINPTVHLCRYEGEQLVSPDLPLHQAAHAKKSESQIRKETPVWSGVLQYFPDAIQAVARVSFKGDAKHNGPNDGARKIQWARGKSMDQEDCVVRHMMTPDEIDPDTGETHLAHAAWRALAALQLQIERNRK
jgi:hypothetical protein